MLRTEIPRAFLPFCLWLGVELTAGQTELARVAFDGGSPMGVADAVSMFGGITEVPVGARSVVAAVCGARAGKSYVLVALRLVFGMLVRDLSSMAPGQRAVALIVAPNDKLRGEVLNYALGAVRSKPELAAMLLETRADEFVGARSRTSRWTSPRSFGTPATRSTTKRSFAQALHACCRAVRPSWRPRRGRKQACSTSSGATTTASRRTHW